MIHFLIKKKHMQTPIKIYGKASSRYNYFKYHLNNQISKYDLRIPLEEIKNIDEIIDAGVEAIPAVKIKGYPMYVCHPHQNINDFLQETMDKIMKVYKSDIMKKILFPTDFSESSKRAFKYVKDMALEMNAAITIVHYYKPSLDISPAHHQDDIAKRMDDFLGTEAQDRNSLYNSISVKREYFLGFAGEEIIKRSEDFNLIVMATSRGLHGSKKWFGSVSKSVAQNASCPVILLPPGDVHESTKKVLYPLKSRMKGFSSIRWLLEELDPELHLVHFNTSGMRSPMIQEILGDHTDLISDDNDWKVTYQNSNCEPEELTKCLSEYINAHDIDLLVLEKGKEHLLEFLLKKSISEKMLDRVEIPVIILHEELYESDNAEGNLKELEKSN